jgi:membrane protease YdiL (CAAX protease family)
MIAYMVAVGIYLGIRYSDYDTIPKHVIKDRAVTDGFVLGGAHAVLVLAAAAVTWRPPPLKARPEPILAWGVALPALAAMLVVNFGFGLFLRFLVEVLTGQRPPVEDLEDLGLGDGWVAILLVCVQPAVVEEVFFRFLLLGHLWRHIGLHGAVWLSSFFFAGAHLGQLIAFPVLLLLGAVLAYARVYSGGLTLPIILHFLHNLAVLWLGPMLDKILIR